MDKGIQRQTMKDTITIPGSIRINHVEGNMASEQVKLTCEDLQRIEAIIPVEIVSGTRSLPRTIYKCPKSVNDSFLVMMQP